jgi:hypothetical protein
MHFHVGQKVTCFRDAPIFLLATITLIRQLFDVPLGRLVADGDVDLALCDHEICDLAVQSATVVASHRACVPPVLDVKRRIFAA